MIDLIDDNSVPAYSPKRRAEVQAQMKTLYAGWPTFIANDEKREAHITKAMKGRRFEDVVLKKTGRWVER